VLRSDPFRGYSDKRLEEITVQHLLEHTAGWDRDTNPEGDPMFNAVKIAQAMNVPAPADALSVIQYILQKPLDFAPGTRFAYSNLGYNILGRIIEEITQTSYEAYVQSAILKPLGITTMTLGRNQYEDKNPLEVRYYDLKNRKVKPVSGESKRVPLPYGGFNLEAMDAHGGWIASAPDLIKLMASLDPNAKNALLKPETVALMTTPSHKDRGYALGWFVNPGGNWWHTGALVGSATLMAHIKDGKKWVLLLNARPEEEEFYPELDRLMWDSLSKVKSWPDLHLKYAEAPLVVSSEEMGRPAANINQPLEGASNATIEKPGS
jgi:CubicO group peptidase (beta-lactamase class C family)